VSSLAKKLQWRRALQLLAMMTELNVPKNVALYNTVISSCAKAREVGMAKNLLSKMRREGIPPNIYTFNSVISACAGTSRWQDALNLVDQCNREPGLTPDIYTYTNAMRACARGGKTRRALSLLQVVKDKGLPVDSYCYTAVIDGKYVKKVGTILRYIHITIPSSHLPLLSACAKAKMWKKALSLLDEMKDRGVEPTHVTYR
jgi:pentatricopeptide repeat domain-containing protein 1